jgi:hypothetical protein
MLPIRCGKCGLKFDRNRKQERVCSSCKPRSQKARAVARAALGVPDGRQCNKPPARTRVAAVWPGADRHLSELTGADYSRRLADCRDWMSRTGLKLTDYPNYGALTAREAAAAIGWVPVPAAWQDAA